MKKLTEDLNRTLVLLEEKGWCRNVSEDIRGRLCLLGAINLSHTTSFMAQKDAVSRLLPNGGLTTTGGDIVDYNDAERRRFSDIREHLLTTMSLVESNNL